MEAPSLLRKRLAIHIKRTQNRSHPHPPLGKANTPRSLGKLWGQNTRAQELRFSASNARALAPSLTSPSPGWPVSVHTPPAHQTRNSRHLSAPGHWARLA